MSLNRKESKARKLAVFAIILDILTFTLGFGFIFIAIGHDANSSTECTSGNGLCSQVHRSSIVFISSFSCTNVNCPFPTFVSTGQGLAIVRQLNQNISLHMASIISNNVASSQGDVRIMQSIVGIPAAGAGVPVGDCFLDGTTAGANVAGTPTSIAIVGLDYPGNCLTATTTGPVFYYLILSNRTGASTETLNGIALYGEMYAIIVY